MKKREGELIINGIQVLYVAAGDRNGTVFTIRGNTIFTCCDKHHTVVAKVFIQQWNDEYFTYVITSAGEVALTDYLNT